MYTLRILFFAVRVRYHDAMTQTDIWNQALGLLGRRSYVEDTETAEAVKLYWPLVMQKAYDFADWSFARRLVHVVTEDGMLAVPGDCLRVIRISQDKFGRYPVSCMQRYGEKILIGEGAGRVWVEYVSRAKSDEQNIPDNEPTFAQALIYLLAGQCAMMLTQDMNMQQAYLSMGQKMLTDARFKDAQQDDSNKQEPFLLTQTLGGMA